ncbi:VanZ family protein [Mariniflexile jejuense]|uniref:VanZ family protein n=1 Tax=Mariniflexile jejuense TaxID=1173582 RepID=A0ABW3JGZ6_9FLAO
MLKKILFLLSILYTIALAIVCLIKINKLPDIGISNADKIYHCLSYIILSLLWYNTLLHTFKLKSQQALRYASGFSIIFGIVIEVLQGALTTSRAADVNDVVANSVGVLFTILVVSLKKINPTKN